MIETKLHKRIHPRLKEYDYSTPGSYFITICTKDKRCMFWDKNKTDIVGCGVPDAPQFSLSKYGKIVDEIIIKLDDFYKDIHIDNYVVMPNHLHILLSIEDGASRTPRPTKQNSVLSSFVSTLKRFCNKDAGENLWQRSFFDHVIRNQKDFDEHMVYIQNNPLKWSLDELFIE